MAASSDPLSVLILHSVGNPVCAPRFLLRHAMSFRDSVPQARAIAHDVSLPLPGYVREAKFDAVFLDVSMLRARWRSAEEYATVRESYGFVREMEAFKIAFPQDEYDCNEVLDDWLCDWRVDRVVSVLEGNHDVLYPRFHKQGAIEVGFTGYVDSSLVDRPLRALAGRPIDIGYRAKRLAPYFGSIGETKWTIGRDVLERSLGKGLVTDIAVGDAKSILGDAWVEFVSSCRFMLGSNSGSSLLDPLGDIQRRVKRFVQDHPAAPFIEVEAACFPGLDRKHQFTALSPRNLEAALLGTGQLLVDGDYSGLLKPGEHYIALRPDASNFDEVVEAMRDVPRVEAMIRRCREAILDEPRLRYEHRDRHLADLIAESASHRNRPAKADAMDAMIERYEQDMRAAYARHWKRQAMRQRLKHLVSVLPTPLALALRRIAKGVGA